MSPGAANTPATYGEQPGSRREQLRFINPEAHASYIVGQLDRVEYLIHQRLDDHEAAARADFSEFQQAVEDALVAIRVELKERDEKTNKRITTMQGMLVAVFASTTSAAIGLVLNLASG